MASRELGGVVDANLLVYGTRNLRVGMLVLFYKYYPALIVCLLYLVDAGIFPLQLSVPPQASIYAIAGKV